MGIAFKHLTVHRRGLNGLAALKQQQCKIARRALREAYPQRASQRVDDSRDLPIGRVAGAEVVVGFGVGGVDAQ